MPEILNHVWGFYGLFGGQNQNHYILPSQEWPKIKTATILPNFIKISIQSQIIYVVREDGKNCQKSYIKTPPSPRISNLAHMSVHGGLVMVNCCGSGKF